MASWDTSSQNNSNINNNLGKNTDNSLLNSSSSSTSTSSTSSTSSSTSLGGSLSSVSSVSTSSQKKSVSSAASSAANDYIKEKRKRLESLWKTKRKVKLKALIDEVSPMAMDFKTASKVISSKSSNLIAYLADVNSGDSYKDLLKNSLTDVGGTVANDEATQKSVAQLNTVKSATKMIESGLKTYNTIEKYSSTAQKVATLAEITWGYAQQFSGGTSKLNATQRMKIFAEAILVTVLQMTLEATKNYIYNIEVEMPELVLGAMKTISVREAVAGYGDISGSWLSSIFTKDFYSTAVASKSWSKAIEDALNKVNNKVNKLSNLVDRVKSLQDDSDGELKARFLGAMKSSFMSTVISDSLTRSAILDGSEIVWYGETESENEVSSYFDETDNTDKTDLEISLEGETNLLNENLLSASKIINTSKEIYNNIDIE